MPTRRHIAHELAAALLAGTWAERPMLARSVSYLGKSTRRWQQRLVEDVLASSTFAYPPAPALLQRRLLASEYFDRAVALVLRSDSPPPVILDPPSFAPADAFASMRPPRLETLGELARWLGISLARLEWLADERRQHHRTAIPILQHYHYRFAPKRSGGPPRLIEAPKPLLRALQRRILTEILDLAPVHDQAHGFVRGRSVLTAAQQHAGEHVVVCADLGDFFPCIRAQRIHGLFRSIGFPHAIARSLTGLCTTATPVSVFERYEGGARHDWRSRKMFATPHLAQGAPTSPALANLCAWRFDQRCAGLAGALGGRYTRYADDLTFSGDGAFGVRISALLAALSCIAREEGFALNPAKTRVMRRATRQRITGFVVNDHVNIARDDYDALKATLHNCRVHGPASQNRDGREGFRAQLDGRVRWVEQVNQARGAKLRAICDAISWD